MSLNERSHTRALLATGPKLLLTGENQEEIKWRALEDDSRTFLRDFVAALPQLELPARLSL